MVKINTETPKKTGLKPGPSRRNSTDDSVIQVSKLLGTTRNHTRASSNSYRPTSIKPKKNEPKPDTPSEYPIGPENIEPKPGPLRRYSIGPENLSPKPSPLRRNSIGPEKIEQKPSPVRRYSTGNSGIKISEPTKPIPNYLRASTGSCHDLCKYGIKYESQTKSRAPPPLPRKHDQKNVQKSRVGPASSPSAKNYYNSKKVLPSARKQQPIGTKNTYTHQPMVTQQNRGLSKKSTNARNSKTSSVKVPIARNSVKNPGTEKTSYEDVPEKIIHVIEPTDENQTKFTSSSSNENKKVDLSAENRTNAAVIRDRRLDIPENRTNATTIRDRRLVIPDERDYSYPRKLKFWRGKVLQMQRGNDGYMKRTGLRRRVVCDGKFVHKNDGFVKAVLRRQETQTRNSPISLMNTVIEETATKLVELRRSKVEALVGAFECVINLQDTESPRASSSTTV